MSAEPFRAAPFRAVKAREGNRAVTRAGSAVTHLLPEAHFRVLDGMRGFLPLGDYERAAARAMGGNPAGVRAALEGLRAKGLLISAAEFLAGAAPYEPAEIGLIGVPTRGGATLERCVTGYAARARERGRAVRFLLAGDIAPERSAAMARGTGAEVVTLNRMWRMRAIGQMAASGVDEALARFALLGEAEGIPPGWARDTGANRNALLVAAVGAPLLSVDDDTCAELLRPPAGSAPPRGFYARGGQVEPWFDTGEPFPCEPAVSADLLAEAGGALGAAWRADSVVAGIEIPHPTFEKLLGGRARVLVAQAGLCGDSGGITPVGWLTTSGPARERLVAGEAGYRRAMISRRILSLAPAVTVTDAEGLMSYCMALDGRALLPPFPPLGRDQDGGFATLLRACDPASFHAHLPLAVRHEPETARAFGPDALTRDAISLTLNDTLRLMATAAVVGAPPLSPEERMRWLGARMREAAQRPEDEYAASQRERRLAALAALIDNFERVLKSFSSRPAWWARDVQALLLACERKMASPDLLEVWEPGKDSPPNTLSICRAYLGWCGRLLEAWPEMLTAARRLADSPPAAGRVSMC